MKSWTKSEIEELVQLFRSQRLPREYWTHQAHLIVAIWHSQHYQKEECICLLRASIILYNAAVSIPNSKESGYHETLTRFWIDEIYAYLQKVEANQSLEQLVNTFLASPQGLSNYPLQFYSKTELESIEARARYLATKD